MWLITLAIATGILNLDRLDVGNQLLTTVVSSAPEAKVEIC